MDTGVYIIFNKINGKFYIGSSARSLHYRFIDHKSKLNRNVHPNRHLQAAWNKYGEANFEFDIIDECLPELTHSIEMYWINMTNCCDREIGYNIVVNSKSTLGFKYNKEQKKKLSDMRKGRKAPWKKNAIFPESARINSYRAVILYTKEFEIIKEFTSIKEAMKELNISRSTIHRLCVYYDTIKNRRGLILRYKN